MNKSLDLSSVRIFSNTKNDILNSMHLVGHQVYLSDYEDFKIYHKYELIGVNYVKDPILDLYPYIGKDGDKRCAHKFLILAEKLKIKLLKS